MIIWYIECYFKRKNKSFYQSVITTYIKICFNVLPPTWGCSGAQRAPLLTTIYIQFYFSMLLSIGFYGAHCAPLHRLCHMWSLMYSISNRDFYVFYFCALQSIIFHGAHLSLSYIDCAIYKVCNNFFYKITAISRNRKNIKLFDNSFLIKTK